MHPKAGQTVTNRYISEMFNVCAQRGIRYSGSLKTGIKHVVLITALHKTPEDLIRNPYKDRKINNRLLYTGEGRFGDQKMERGNWVLKQQMEKKYPLYVFEKKSPGKYVFLGPFRVLSVQEEIQKDSHGRERRVFLYELCKFESQTSKNKLRHHS